MLIIFNCQRVSISVFYDSKNPAYLMSLGEKSHPFQKALNNYLMAQKLATDSLGIMIVFG